MTVNHSPRAELRLDQNDSTPGSSRSSFLLFAIPVVLFVAARLWRLTASCLWFDEIFGVHAARMKWAVMFKFVAADIIHPPLFYALLKLWIGIGGESLLWLRLLPVILSTVALVPVVLLCRELRLRANEINLTIALLAVSGYLIKYAQEVRMYSLLFLLTSLSLWLFVKYINARAKPNILLLALATVNLLLIYSHYYGWFAVLIELFVLLCWWRKKAVKFLLTIVALVLSYLPWLYLITISKEPGRGLAQNIGWVARPGPGDLAQFFSMLNTPFFFRQSSASTISDVWGLSLSLIVFGVPLGLLLKRNLKRSNDTEKKVVWWLISFTFLPVVFAFLLSWLMPHSIWGTRHLIVAAAPYAVLASLALFRARPAWLRTTCLALLACWVLLNGAVVLFKRPTNLIWCTWEPLAQQLVKVEADESHVVKVYAFEDLVAYHLWFAIDTARREGFASNLKINVVKGIPGLREDPAYFLPRRFYEIETHDGATLNGEIIWIAFRDTEWNLRRPPLNLLEQQGYETGRVFELSAQGQRAFMVELRRKGPTQ